MTLLLVAALVVVVVAVAVAVAIRRRRASVPPVARMEGGSSHMRVDGL